MKLLGTFLNTDLELSHQFASDRYLGISLEAWKALEAANLARPAASDAFCEFFEADCEFFLACRGTAAGSLALGSLRHSCDSVICAKAAHVKIDECGAPEFASNGSMLLVTRSEDGKLSSWPIYEPTTKRHDIYLRKQDAVTVTRSTSTGLVYTLQDLRTGDSKIERIDELVADFRQCVEKPAYDALSAETRE